MRRLNALSSAQESRIHAKLDHMLWFGGACEFCVGYIVSVIAQLRGHAVYAQKKIREPVPRGIEERALIHDISASAHCLVRAGDTFGKPLFAGYLSNGPTFFLQPDK